MSSNRYSVQQNQQVALIDVLDKVLEKGAVVSGDLAVRVADVDLIYVGLRLLVTSISKAEEVSGRPMFDPRRQPTTEDLKYAQNLEREIAKAEKNIATLVDMGKPEEIDQGLSRLVLTVVTLLKRLMEREALRRMQGGTLANIEVEKLGLAFMAMEKKLEELKLIFGLRDDDLNITLGPLGNLM